MRQRPRPRRLRDGDTAAVVAPAGPIPDRLLEAGVEHLRSWGLHVVLGDHVHDRHLNYLAGTDTNRARDLQWAWCDPEVDAVLCARGGYGCMRMLDQLDWSSTSVSEPAIFMGSSDVTALHEMFHARLGVPTIFGPMIATEPFIEDAPAREHLRRSLFEPESVTTLTDASADSLVPGRAEGTLYGGNLSILAGTLAASDTPAPPAGGIALLEDITEDPYQLDRFLTQLRRAGWFAECAGIALGSWTECGSLDQIRTTMLDRLGDLGVPVLWELGFGHRAQQLTVPLGVTARLDTETRSLTMPQPALL